MFHAGGTRGCGRRDVVVLDRPDRDRSRAGRWNLQPETPGASAVLHVPTYGSISRGRCLIADLADHPQMGHRRYPRRAPARTAPSRRLAAGGRPAHVRRRRRADLGDGGLGFRPDAHGADGVVHRVLAFCPQKDGTWALSLQRALETGSYLTERGCRTGCGRCWCARAGTGWPARWKSMRPSSAARSRGWQADGPRAGSRSPA